jgi:hypothetical protein
MDMESKSSGMTKLIINWTANPPSEQVTSYDLQITHNGVTAPPLQVATNQHEIQDPTPGTYSFSVRARNLAGNSPFGAVASTPPIPSTPPAPTIQVIVT